jgi:hypothetical protein
MNKTIAALGIAALMASVSYAGTVNYGWEDGVGTVLGSYGNLVNPANVSTGSDPGTNNENPSHDPPLTVAPNSGSRMLEVMESPHSSTPQAFLAYIENLQAGDVVTASFFGWDSTPDVSPSLRIWGHWANNGDVTSYAGSAGGSDTYTTGPETGAWSLADYTWTVPDAPDNEEALVIEARLYSTPSTGENSTTYWVDDVSVTAPDHATISVPVPEPMAIALLGIGGLLTLLRRRRK